MLTLDEMTLFFFSFVLSSLNDDKPGPLKKHKTPVSKWLNGVPPTTPPPSRSDGGSILSSTRVPSLTIGSTRSMTTSVLTQGIRVTQKKFPHPPKAELIKSYIEVGEWGAISHYDKTQGRE